MIIAVDGPTASGKGTIARALSMHFGLPHLDTGLLYRAVGFHCNAMGGDPDNANDALAACDFPPELLANDQLRSEAVGALASRVSIHPQVRAALYERQRAFAHQTGGAVLDGRDIGTVIAPDADVKLFVTASVDARAQRRCAEMERRAMTSDYSAIRADLIARDARDTERKDAPLYAALDAYTIDTTTLTADEAIARAIEAVNAKRLDRD